MHYEVKLDDIQNSAANHLNGACIVTAGPGSGKTSVITERTARLIESGIPARNILQLTFSRKASREMWARLHTRLGEPNRDDMPRIENFHTLGWRMIQSHPDVFDRQRGVSILTVSDQKSIMRAAMKAYDIDKIKELRLGLILGCHDALANDGHFPITKDTLTYVHEVLTKKGVAQSFHEGVLNAFDFYEKFKKSTNVVDFSDLISLTVHGLKKDARFTREITEWIKFLSVDEFQDTNNSQYELIQLIAPHGNIFAVGDDDQCIYGWRGARHENFGRLSDEFGATIHRLERNYRSSKHIIEHATKLIEYNLNRMPKKPYSLWQNGRAPLAAHYNNDRQMSEMIAKSIRRDLEQGIPASQIAVLYRTNRLAALIEPALIKYDIPYHITQGTDLFERQEAQMLLAAIRSVVNPLDELALARIATSIEGLGERSVQKMFNYAHENNVIPIMGRHYFKEGKTKNLLNELARRLDILSIWSPDRCVEWALETEGGNIEPWIKGLTSGADDPIAAYNKRINTLILLNEAISSRLQHCKERPFNEQWAEIAELGLSTPDQEEHKNVVTLSSIFAAKGLEYRKVHLLGASEGLMPLLRNEDDDVESQSSMEEERRLFYVGVTRSKDAVILHSADKMDFGYKQFDLIASRFINEMGIKTLDMRDRVNDFKNPEPRTEVLQYFGIEFKNR